METRGTNINENARATILASIRQSLAASERLDRVRSEHHHASENRSSVGEQIRPAISQDALIENFRINLESVGGRCVIAKHENEASDYLRGLISRRQMKLVATSDSELVKRIVESIPDVEFIQNGSTDVLFECDLGVTGAQWAIAETGTLVLESEAESHRLTSLVPPVHLCILNAGKIRQTLGEILGSVTAALSPTITFITGASRTSDIELTLAIGVHGPAELHVIVIAD